MNETARDRTFWKAFGPGLLWAGAAIGVSHLVQSTQAGEKYGFALMGLVFLALIFKYPAFSFGPRYAAATGTSLLEGYRRRGMGALVLYGVLTFGTMFTIQAVVTLVTAALGIALLDLPSGVGGISTLLILSAALTAVCAVLLYVGHYRWLDRIIKVTVLLLTVSTLAATALVLPKVDWSTFSLLPPWDLLTTGQVLFVVALVGWMPSAFDISIWHSLWTLARKRDTDHAPSVKDALIDFNVGYLGTGLLAFCFITLGAFMRDSGATFSPGAATFAQEVIQVYTDQLGVWSRPLIGLAAFTVMFSTTLTVVDGFPRAISTLIARFREAETPNGPASVHQPVYWGSLVLLAAGACTIVGLLGPLSFKWLVNLAMLMSFLTAPVLAVLNHKAILGSEVPAEHRPDRRMVLYSWAGIVFSAMFALWYLYVAFLS